MNTDDIIILTPITRKGKNALQNKTNRWRVFAVCDSVSCLNNQPGIGLLEVPEHDRMPDCRWIKQRDDANFTWVTEDN